jgi:hypothetical protein
VLRATVAVAMSLAVSVAGGRAWANAVGPIPSAAPAAAGADSPEVNAAYERAMNALAGGAPGRALEDLDFVALHAGDASRRASAAALAARIRTAHPAPAGAAGRPQTSPPASPPTPAAPTTAVVAAPQVAPAPAAPPAPTAGRAAVPIEEPDQAGRTVFLATTSLLGLTAYGWTVPTALDIESDKTFLALYMLTAGTSFVAPYLLTRHGELTWGTTNAAWYGGTRGILHGLMLGRMITPDGSTRGTALAILIGSALELTGATWWATAQDPTAGTVRTMAWAGDFGLLGGLALAHLTGLDLHDSHSSFSENDTGARLLLASGLVGNAAGLILGKMFADSNGARLTWGDGEVNRAAGLLGAFAAGAVADWFGAFDEDSSRIAVGALLAGGAAGLYLGHKLAVRTDFTVGRAVLVDLGTLAGGLLGAGITYLATPEGYDNHTPYVTAAAGGAILGFALTTYSLGVPGSLDSPAGRTAFSPQLVPLLGQAGQRGIALAGLF